MTLDELAAKIGINATTLGRIEKGQTQKISTDVLNRLLEHPRFPILVAMIAQYLDDTFAAGVAVQNQIFASMSELLVGAGQLVPPKIRR